MLALRVTTEGDGCWPDLEKKEVIHVTGEYGLIQIAGLREGMKSGRSSVSIRIDLPDGRVVVAETTMRLFQGAARALAASHVEGKDW